MPSSSPSAITADSFLSRDRRLTLDCLRGLLALMLVLLHMGQQDIGVLPQAWMHQRLISVGIFFTLSGFLVTRSILQKPVFDHLGFAKARIQRIYPSYLLCIFFALTVTDAYEIVGKPMGWALGNLLSHLTLTHAWFDGHSSGVLPPLWTLSHEWGFYAFILCMAGVLRSRAWWIPVLLVLVGAMFCRYALRQEWFVLPNDYRHPFCIMDFFAPGIALAILLQNEKVLQRLKSGRMIAALLLVGGVLIGWAFYRHYEVAFRLDDTRYQGMKFYFAFEMTFLKDRSSLLFYQPALAIGSALLILVLWMRPSVPARLLRFTPLPWMGKVSYSTYLWHMMVVLCFVRARKRVPEDSLWEEPVVYFAVVLGAIYGLSAITWQYMEKPFLKKRKQSAAGDGAMRAEGHIVVAQTLMPSVMPDK